MDGFDGAPKLSLPIPDPVGRMYRRPGSEEPTFTAGGKMRLPRGKELREKVKTGEYVPSITNVVGVRNAPHLLGWAAYKSAQSAVLTEQSHPGHLLTKPQEAIKYFSKAHERDRDEAAAQGTLIHQACENYVLGKEIPQMSPRQNAYLNSFKRFIKDFSPKFLHLEATVFGTTPNGLSYAGTTDFVAMINGLLVYADIKTTRSGLHPDLAVQLSAITHAQELVLADNINTEPLPKAQAAIGVHLSPEAYKVAPVSVNGQVWDTFCGLRDVWDFHAFDGELNKGSHAVESFINSPQALEPFSEN